MISLFYAGCWSKCGGGWKDVFSPVVSSFATRQNKVSPTTTKPTTARQNKLRPTTARQNKLRPTTARQNKLSPTTARQNKLRPTTARQNKLRPTTTVSMPFAIHHFSTISLLFCFKSSSTFRDSEVRMLTHTYPHKPLMTITWQSAITRLIAHLTFGLMSYQVIWFKHILFHHTLKMD